MVAIVRPFQAHLLLHALVIDALGPTALIELHIARALLHAVDVAHELGGAGGFHLAEELHGATGHLLASAKASPLKDIRHKALVSPTAQLTIPRILCLAPAEHELIVLHLTVFAKVHCCRSQGGCTKGHLDYTVKPGTQKSGPKVSYPRKCRYPLLYVYIVVRHG